MKSRAKPSRNRVQPSVLAQRDVESRAAAKLTTAFENFMSAPDAKKKCEAGRDLIRSVFGNDSIPEDLLG